tara:strand:- start:914 stop:1153 length:240 start_codon:yes stop_codon:yes gene_type:complete
MKKIKTTLDVLGLFLVWGLVFFTAGMMFEGIANYGLYDVLKSCAVIFGFGGICTMFVIQHVSDVVELKADAKEKSNANV